MLCEGPQLSSAIHALEECHVTQPKPPALWCSGLLRPASAGATCCTLVVLNFIHCLLPQKMEKGPDGTYPYKSPVDCAMKTFTQEGPLKFYTGFPTYCLRWGGVDHRSVHVCFMQGAHDLCCQSLHAYLELGQLWGGLGMPCVAHLQTNGSISRPMAALTAACCVCYWVATFNHQSAACS